MMKKILFLIACMGLLLSLFQANAGVIVVDTRCEMLVNPIGIDAIKPRLSWQLCSDDRGIVQTAYRIIVASSPEKLMADYGDLWDSGKVLSDRSVLVEYEGEPLKSRINCFWKAKVWTRNAESTNSSTSTTGSASANNSANTNSNASEWSEPAHWSIGLLNYKDWGGRWIGFDRPFEWDSDTFHSRLSARYFRKEFELKKEIKQAKAYIIGLGLYELSVNGQKAGDHVLSPAPTDYDKNIKYNVLDVTALLKQGANTAGVVLGNGRYYTMRQHYKGYKIKNFGFPKLLFQLEIEFTDGTRTIVKSDDTWRGTADGPIRTNNEYDGEEYDARKEMPGWDSPGFDDRNWLVPEYVGQPDGIYEAQMNPHMRVLKEMKPVGISRAGNGKYILDMGQNMVGWLQIRVKGSSGDTVKMRFGEILNNNGEILTQNLRDAKAMALYTLKGIGMETWEPRFVYYGFRYVEITGWPGIPSLEDFTAKVVSDEMAVTGEFATSNALINQIYKNAYWGILGNYKGMPVDCPQRNERQPWLGDRPVGSYGESFIFDNAMLYVKWLDDIAYSQKSDGCISDVAPAFWRYYSDNMTWPGTYLMVADMLYKQYADIRPIEKHYPAMKKWLEYMRENYMTDDFIVTKDSYGDWCVPPATIEEGRGKSADRKYPSKLISTAYYYYFMELMQKFATLTGNTADIEEFTTLASNIKTGFNKAFYNPDSGGYGENKLTDNILALRLGLVPEDRREKVFTLAVNNIMEDHDGHLSTGVIGLQWLMCTLSANGRHDIAYRLATNKTYPSWGYMVENGATTIWELWNGNTADPKMNSYNHVMMLGDLIIWFYEHIAGIKSSGEAPGFKQIVMNPEFFSASSDQTKVVSGSRLKPDISAGRPEEQIEYLDFVNASYSSVHGLIRSEWKKEGNSLTWNISIPANTSALVHIPAKTRKDVRENGNHADRSRGVEFVKTEGGRMVYKVGSGDYSFTTEW